MPFAIDLIVFAIIILFTFIGYKRGFVKIAFSLCTFIVALIVTLILYKPVSSLVISQTEFDEKIESAIVDNILPDGISANDEIDLKLEDNIYHSLLKEGTNSIQGVAETFSTKIIETIVFLILFTIAKIALRFVTFFADLVAKLPILNQFNRLGGIIFGFLQGILIILVILALISLFAPMVDKSIITSINDSMITSKIYANNILLNFIAL